MKKEVKLLLTSAMLIAGVATIAFAPNSDIIEGAYDANNIGVNLKNINIGNSEQVNISKTFVQHGSEGSRQFLRFATAVSGPIDSIKYSRTVEGLGTKESVVTTVYKGIQAGSAVYYYDGENAVTTASEQTEDFYWACYTIEFASDTYRAADVSAYITVESSSSGTIQSEEKVTSLYSQLEANTNHYIYTIGDLERFKSNAASGFNYNGKVVTLMNDIEVTGLDSTYLDIKNSNITLDLNGHKLSFVTDPEVIGAIYAINVGNNSKLTINDSSSDGSGEVSIEYIGGTANPYSYASNVISVSNSGELVVNNGNIVNYTARITGIVRNAIDSLNYGANGTNVTINGGTIYCVNGYGIRMFCNGTDSVNYLEINDGNIKGTYPVVLQTANANHMPAKLIINGGNYVGYVPWSNVTTTPLYVWRAANCSTGDGCDVKDVEIQLNNGFTLADISYGNDYDLTHADIRFPVDVNSQDSLTSAIENGDNIELTSNVKLSDDTVYSIAKNEDIRINLNGNNIEVVSKVGKASSLFSVNSGASLTIAGEGSINYTAEDPATGSMPTYASNVISNRGTLVIDDATITNNSAGSASYVIDNYDGGDLTINGGTFTQSVGACAIRMFAASASSYNNVTINGGDFVAKRPIWIQLAGSDSAVAPNVNLTINGGTFTSYDTEGSYLALYSYSYGNSFANTSAIFNGGHFNGFVAFGGGYKGDRENVVINGGSISSDASIFRYTSDGVEYYSFPNA